MPTGYTAGILDGKIKNFKQFATQCLRAFVIHMRDDSWDKPYYPRTPSDYHLKEIKKAESLLKYYTTATDKEIISLKQSDFAKDEEYHLNKKKEMESNHLKLKDFLQEAINYSPPTALHNGIKDFMIEQLTSTIKFDASSSYHDDHLKKIAIELESMDVVVVRKELIEEANRDLAYHKKEYTEELVRCDEHNKWAQQYLDSLK